MQNLKTNVKIARNLADGMVRVNAQMLKTFAELSVETWENWNKQVDTAFQSFEADLTKKS